LIRPKDQTRAVSIDTKLIQFSKNHTPLIGIKKANFRASFVAQILESIRRIEFLEVVASRPISNKRADPSFPDFDPLRAAILADRSGDREEAFWLVFLATHFGKHHPTGWALARAFYGCLDAGPNWSWARVISNPEALYTWIKNNEGSFSSFRFGNHRKYESKKVDGKRGLKAVLQSYLDWVGASGKQTAKIGKVIAGTNDPTVAFDQLYRSLHDITSWGRLAIFDHLTMLAKLKILNIEAGSTYLKGASGPLLGAKLLLTGSADTGLRIGYIESVLKDLGGALNVNQQVIEDSICNWQKSPEKFLAFR